MAILILGASDDEHAIHMRVTCAKMGLMCPDRLRLVSGEMTIAFDPEDGTGRSLFRAADRFFDAVTSVYWRNYDGAYPSSFRTPIKTISPRMIRSLFNRC